MTEITALPEHDVRSRAFAMPFGNPAYTPPPNRFLNRSLLTVSYRTTAEALSGAIPAPLTVRDLSSTSRSPR